MARSVLIWQRRTPHSITLRKDESTVAPTTPTSSPPDTEPDTKQDGDEDTLSKALLGLRTSLTKSDLPLGTRERLQKAALALERESLARTNPRASDEWQRTWGGPIHGVAI
jgi:hypothetical protein